MTELKLSGHRRYLLEQELMFLAGQPAVYHCHHFNLFLDQTIDDALGRQGGTQLRIDAAREFSRKVIDAVCAREDATTPPEKLALAQELFRQVGQGQLELNADADGGSARGSHLHYSFSWHEKYGKRVRRRHPADGFAAGFAAGAIESAYELTPGSMACREGACFAMKEPACEFTLVPQEPPLDASGSSVDEEVSKGIVGLPEDGLREDVIQPITAGLKEFTAGIAGDQRGLVQAFGVFVTMHFAGYYNRISFDAAKHIAEKAPQSLEVFEELLRESGHVCVFNTFGGILLSPEWEGLVGPVTDNPLDILTWCMATGRALGMGRWIIAEFVEDQRFVLRTSGSYESVYYRARHGQSERHVEYFLQGAALAMAQLAHRVKLTEKPKLTPEYYQALFKGGVPWKAEQTRSLLRGDDCSEVVVTKI